MLIKVEVDKNFRERMVYDNPLFPFQTCTDVFSRFIANTLNCHWHPEFEFGIVLKSEVEYYINDNHIHLKEGDGIFINSNTMHMATTTVQFRDAMMATIVFSPQFLSGNISGPIYQKYIQPVVSNSDQAGFVLSPSRDWQRQIIQALLDAYALDETSIGYELKCSALIQDMWHTLVSHFSDAGINPAERGGDRRCEERVRAMLSFIHDHYSEDISIMDIAEAANVSRSECFRSFKKITNKKPVEYINEYRLAQAAALLLETNRAVSEISMDCGFSSSSYFGKLFREKTGMSPGSFRSPGA